jgi:flagellar biosynthetic protein FliO
MFILICGLSVSAQDVNNTINSVKVQQSGDNAVVVDVYVNENAGSPKPQISSRTHQNDKFVIDLINVRDEGNVSKDTSASSGLVKNKNLRIGNIQGGSVSRVLIDLENPDVKVKEVRYHVVGKGQTPPIVATSSPEPAPVKPAVVTQPKPEPVASKPAPAPAPKKIESPPPKVESKPAPPKATAVAVAPKAEKQVPVSKPAPPSNTESASSSGPVVVHKTDPKSEVVQQPSIAPQAAVAQKPVTKPEVVKKTSDPEKQLEKKLPNTDNSDTPQEKQKTENDLLAQATPEKKPEPVNTPAPAPAEITEQTPVSLGDTTADNAGVRTIDTGAENLNYGDMIATFGWALVVVIPLILVAAWIMNMVYKGGENIGLKSLTGSSGNKFKILSSTTLGQGKSVHLVEIKGKQLVIGCTNNSINILTEFNDFDEFVETSRTQERATQTGTPQATPTESSYKRSRPPIGSFADLYKDYQNKIDETDLEDEY